MEAYIYQAALLCEDCARKTQSEWFARNPGAKSAPEDSDQYPQGPYSDGGGEADSPCHCDHCRVFLENPLTGDGYEYVLERLQLPGDVATLEQWRAFYGDDHFGRPPMTINEILAKEGA